MRHRKHRDEVSHPGHPALWGADGSPLPGFAAGPVWVSARHWVVSTGDSLKIQRNSHKITDFQGPHLQILIEQAVGSWGGCKHWGLGGDGGSTFGGCSHAAPPACTLVRECSWSQCSFLLGQLGFRSRRQAVSINQLEVASRQDQFVILWLEYLERVLKMLSFIIGH